MTAWIVFAIVSVALAALVGWLLPVFAAKRLVPTLASRGPEMTNYRGVRVPHGLGLVWVVWAIGIAAVSNVVAFGAHLFITSAVSAGAPVQGWWMSLAETPFSTAVVAVPVLLVIGAAALGLADDVFGGGDAKGFRGHLAALRHGRLTTGMLKMLGIGLIALVSATGIASTIGRFDPMVDASTGWLQGAYTVLAWVAATLVIALTANLVNLTDLRPGRALKTYVVLALAGAGISIWGLARVMEQRIVASAAAAAVNGAAAATPGLPSGPDIAVWLAGSAVCLLVLVLGPVFALWRYDLGERAMLGDAGANAMGAVAGFLLARSAPLWLLGVLALVLLALNLASERVSFTAVIERVGVLRWIDGLGRTTAWAECDIEHGSDDGEQAGGPDSKGDDARRDDVS
jgi:UDP-GlcNAc:undecaprenyl-phosphate GlcNAc-1-phosphate transferase